jgi:sodium transport system ATP-binding protein
MITLSEINKSFPGKREMALSGISFSIGRGEAVALVGENGAGKTTLIRILSLILKPDNGFFSFDNIKFSDNPDYIKSKTGTLFSGEGSLYDRLTAEENIKYYAELNGVCKNDYRKRIEPLIEDLSLSAFLNDRVSTFSRGMKQRTAIARALITDPDFIILDEPSTGLDIIAGNSVKRIINRLKHDGKTILFSSHNTDEIFTCADRITVIHKGKINCDKTAEEYRAVHGLDLTVYIKE